MDVTPHRNWKHEDRLYRNPDYPNLPGVKLFMYDIKDVNRFYFRNHPRNIDPKSERFAEYWVPFEKKCIEGLWVDDGGTWVYLMPKLFHYLNYVTIHDKRKGKNKIISPDCTHVEWAVFSYIMCCDGFSGFEDDDRYTCHETARKIEHNTLSDSETDKIFISQYEKDNLPDYCYNKKGKLKIYIDPWEYLTRVYLYDDPLGQPLGKACYDNPLYDGCIFGARGTGKSYTIFSGDLLHEWEFGGIKDYDNINLVNIPNIFCIASTQTTSVDKTLNHVQTFYNNQPGKYIYPEGDRADYMGPFYRKIKGAWETGSTIENEVKNTNNTTRLKGPTIFINALTIDKFKVGAGDRAKRMYFEEFGFLSFAKSVYTANKDSMALSGFKTGNAFYLGTAGDMGTIDEPKDMFEHPSGYDIFPITDYYKNPKRKVGFFLSQLYSYRDYNDKNGNVDVPKMLELTLERRKQDAKVKDADTIGKDNAFNPIVPDEMLVSSGFSILPKEEANKQYSNMEAYGWHDDIVTYGELVFSQNAKNSVEFAKKPFNDKQVIVDNSYNTNGDLRGMNVFYEHPPSIVPADLYYIIFDPVKNKEYGTSLNSMLVYKGIYTNNPSNFEDTIVAERNWRDKDLEDTYMQVIKMAIYYNAKIFPERNVTGFKEWCETKGFVHLLVNEPHLTLRSLNFTPKPFLHGFDMQNDKLKQWALSKLNTWLLSHHEKDIDPKTQFPLKRKINYIFSKKILNEVRTHTLDGNFDAISCLLGLMLLKNELGEKIIVEGMKADKPEVKINQMEQRRFHRIKKSKFQRR